MRLMNRKPSKGATLALALIPFVMVMIAYFAASISRHAANPNDRVLPTVQQMVATFGSMGTEPDRRTGELTLWTDTAVSLQRLGIALAGSVAITLLIGMAIGVVPYIRALLDPFVAVVSLVPPLALLPILFIAVGLGEASKILLIMIGITPIMIRDLALRIQDLPREMTVKALTLGASSWQYALRVVLPQIGPRLIDSLRLALGPAWLFLIAAEAIAADGGLGYRIFLVRRFFAMDVIFPYVAWITLLAFLMDWGLRFLQRKLFPWHFAAMGVP